MPSNKNQHFVPRCYLRPFSMNKEGRAINLYTVSRERFVQNASISGQCSGDYFYGEDLALEKALGYFEGNYAKVTSKLHDRAALSEEDLGTLRHFALLQYMRTKVFIAQLQAAMHGMNQALASEARNAKGFEADTSHERNMLLAIKMWFENREAIDDLKTVLFINQTRHEFITSDDPSTFTNRFLLQKMKISSFGLGSAGVCFFLPLTPMHLLLCYDGAVYTVPRDEEFYIDVNSKDVLGSRLI
jgi:hypothetical protein